jgi:hypothetical protein
MVYGRARPGAFEQPTWQSVRVNPHHRSTLADGRAFHVQPALSRGGSAVGSLITYTVYLQ